MAEEYNVNSSSVNNEASAEDITAPGQSSIIDGTDGVLNQKGIGSSNSILNKGIVFPVIRINDHYCIQEEIREFYIESGYYKDYNDYQEYGYPVSGFVPQLHLILRTKSPDMLKQNQIKTGDICAVFFHGGGSMVKSYRGDYIIKSVVTTGKNTEVVNAPVTYIIEAELYIPNLTNETIKFNFNGSSRDAMYDCASRLGLAFFFNDPDDTQDIQGWICSKNLKEYALEVTSHAYKEFNAFYESWIDPRYGLSFININKQLVEDGLDEPIDITPFVNTINRNIGIDGRKVKDSDEKERADTRPQAKIISNIVRDDESATPFYIKKWNIVNQASEIAMSIGMNRIEDFNTDNPGLETANTNISMSYSIPMNQTKLNNGFYVMTGSGINLTYTQADQVVESQSFVKNMSRVKGGSLTDIMSNDDAQQMLQTGGNMYSSGNTNRFFTVGWEHNMMNNLQLQKQILEVELQGCNLAIMRGEKLPVIIMDYDRLQALARSANFPASTVENCLYVIGCGWYIIDGIMWYWSQDDNSNGTTLWTTKLKLVRREWPIPGHNGNITTTGQELTQEIDLSNSVGNTVEIPKQEKEKKPEIEIVGSAADSAVNVDEDDKTDSGDVPLSGLTHEMKDVYKFLKDICPKIKLVSARRWAVDEDGNRVEGNAYVQVNGMYKCCNAKGEIMYFKSNNSRHLYGQAIDIINDSGLDFNAILTDYIVQNDGFLETLAKYGMAVGIEKTTDDTGVATKHYHIGTEQDIQNNFWNTVLALRPNIDSSAMSYIKNRQMYNKNALSGQYAELKRSTING